MLRKVYLEGELGDKFGKSFTVNAVTLQDVFRCADANFSGFRKHLIDCHEKDIGFIVDIAEKQVHDENQLLMPIKPGDVTITPVPAGSKGIGKILAAIAIIVVVAMTGGWALGAAGGTTFSAGLTAGMGSWGGLLATSLATNLAMTGISEMMAPDPSTDTDQESSYMFNGAEQNIIEGDPVPVLYGHLRVPGQPISFDSISATFASDDNTTQTKLQFPHPNKDISQGRFVRA